MDNNEQPAGPQEYDQLECPNCGCPDVYVGELCKGAIEAGILPPNAVQFASFIQNMVPPKPIADKLPLGSSVANFTMGFDVCMKCHTLYARKVIIGTSTKIPPPPKIIVPGQN